MNLNFKQILNNLWKTIGRSRGSNRKLQQILLNNVVIYVIHDGIIYLMSQKTTNVKQYIEYKEMQTVDTTAPPGSR